VFDDEAKMLDIVPKYKGMDTLTAREEIVKDLEKEGVLVKIEDYAHNVGKCYRCHSTIEPKPSEQWFVKMEPLAKPAIKAVKEGKTKEIKNICDNLKLDKTVLFVTDKKDDLALRATGNIQRTDVETARLLDVYSVVVANKLVLTKAAAKSLEEAYKG